MILKIWLVNTIYDDIYIVHAGLLAQTLLMVTFCKAGVLYGLRMQDYGSSNYNARKHRQVK
jgi:hypothetical protein